MKKMTYATTVIVRKRTIAQRIRRTRYWNIAADCRSRAAPKKSGVSLRLCRSLRSPAVRRARRGNGCRACGRRGEMFASTVFGLMNSCAATSRFVRPDGASSATRRSLSVRSSGAARRRPIARELVSCALRPERRGQLVEESRAPLRATASPRPSASRVVAGARARAACARVRTAGRRLDVRERLRGERRRQRAQTGRGPGESPRAVDRARLRRELLDQRRGLVVAAGGDQRLGHVRRRGMRCEAESLRLDPVEQRAKMRQRGGVVPERELEEPSTPRWITLVFSCFAAAASVAPVSASERASSASRDARRRAPSSRRSGRASCSRPICSASSYASSACAAAAVQSPARSPTSTSRPRTPSAAISSPAASASASSVSSARAPRRDGPGACGAARAPCAGSGS